MSAVKLSVIVPVFNGGATLGACLEALKAALPPDSEITVVDDASTDATAAIAAGCSVRRLTHPANRGTSAARNTGWRASDAGLVAFVDADVVVAPEALVRLVAALEADPSLLGVNGLFSTEPCPGLVSDFANLSLHHQLRSHGMRVASAFTGLCLLRRRTLEQMGGWDERFHSRYADDVNSRFLLPPQSLGLVPEAVGAHLKRVSFRGLLRHRANVGWFFLRSLGARRAIGRVGRGNAVLSLRYPVNTTLAAASLLAPFAPAALPVLALLFLVVNTPFLLFYGRARGLLGALAALGLSGLESFGFFFGMAASMLSPRRLPLADPEPVA